MRKVPLVELASDTRITKSPFEIRAERFAMAPPADVQVIPGEKQAELRWKAENNPFIESYTVERREKDQLTVTRNKIDSTEHQFIDTHVEEEMSYTYRLKVRFKSGAELYSELFTVTTLPVIKETALLQNYPNPFNPETWIPYDLEKGGDVTIELYNVNGQLVRTLSIGLQSRGRYTSRAKAAYWDGRNQFGERAASGIYFYVLRTTDFASTRKMLILK